MLGTVLKDNENSDHTEEVKEKEVEWESWGTLDVTASLLKNFFIHFTSISRFMEVRLRLRRAPNRIERISCVYVVLQCLSRPC